MTDPAVVVVEERSKRGFGENFQLFSSTTPQKSTDAQKDSESKGNFMSILSKQVVQVMSTPMKMSVPGSMFPFQSASPTNAQNPLHNNGIAVAVTGDRGLLEEQSPHREASASFKAMAQTIWTDVDKDDVQEIQEDGFAKSTMDFDDVDDSHLLEDIRIFQQDTQVQEALAKGVDLRQFAKQIAEDLKNMEKDSIQDYISQTSRISHLHQEIRVSSRILERMEGMLFSFQSNLGTLTDEIGLLQIESKTMATSLVNRKKVEEDIVNFLEQIALPAALISSIVKGPINDQFDQSLHELDAKLAFCQKHQKYRATAEVLPELEKLKLKASSKCRDHLLELLGQMKKPGVKLHTHQESVLMPKQYLNKFLLTHNKAFAQEVQEQYTDIVARYYLQEARKLTATTAKSMVEVVTRNDLLVGDEGHFRLLSGKVTPKGKETVFSLSGRDWILGDTNEQEQRQLEPHRRTFEVIFEETQMALINTCRQEIPFITAFFGGMYLFHDILGKALSVFQDVIREQLTNCFDPIGLFLSICSMHRHRLVALKHCLSPLEHHLDGLNIQLWTRFKLIFDMNMDSLRAANIKSLWKNDTGVHAVTRRFADFVAALLKLRKHNENDTLANTIERLQREMDNFLKRLAGMFPVKKQQVVFLMNNVDHVMTVCEENNLTPQDTSWFQKNMGAHTLQFVSDELMETFGPMMTFVSEVDKSGNQEANATTSNLQPSRAQQIVADFSTSWQKSLERISQTTTSYFPNPKYSAEVLQEIFSQFMAKYTIFYNFVRRTYNKEPFVRDLVHTNAILFEARKYQRGSQAQISTSR